MGKFGINMYWILRLQHNFPHLFVWFSRIFWTRLCASAIHNPCFFWNGSTSNFRPYIYIYSSTFQWLLIQVDRLGLFSFTLISLIWGLRRLTTRGRLANGAWNLWNPRQRLEAPGSHCAPLRSAGMFLFKSIGNTTMIYMAKYTITLITATFHDFPVPTCSKQIPVPVPRGCDGKANRNWGFFFCASHARTNLWLLHAPPHLKHSWQCIVSLTRN